MSVVSGRLTHMSEQPFSQQTDAAPSGPAAWTVGPWLGFDTETTGINPKEDRLVTAALVYRGSLQPDGTRAQKVGTWLADPGVVIPEQAAAVHGITTEQAQRDGRPVEEVLEEVATALCKAMQVGTPIVAYNATYDLTLMECELTRHQLPTLEQRLGRAIGPVIDPLVLDRTLDRWRKGKRRLGDLCEIYGVNVSEELHTAEVDVAATLDVLAALVNNYSELATMPADRLLSWQATAHREWATSLNEYLARVNPERTPASLAWPVDLD